MNATLRHGPRWYAARKRRRVRIVTAVCVLVALAAAERTSEQPSARAIAWLVGSTLGIVEAAVDELAALGLVAKPGGSRGTGAATLTRAGWAAVRGLGVT